MLGKSRPSPFLDGCFCEGASGTVRPVGRPGILASLLVASACENNAPTGVGDECRPLVVPENGFHATEVFVEVGVRRSESFSLEIVESTHPDCRTGFCIVNHYEGDFIDESEDEIAERVYCTCKCGVSAGGDAQSTTCNSCPEGFECCPIFAIGGEFLKGDYCVREGTCER